MCIFFMNVCDGPAANETVNNPNPNITAINFAGNELIFSIFDYNV